MSSLVQIFFPLPCFEVLNFMQLIQLLRLQVRSGYGRQHGAGRYQWVLDIRLIHCTVVLTMGSFSTLQMSSSRPLKYKAKYLKPCI